MVILDNNNNPIRASTHFIFSLLNKMKSLQRIGFNLNRKIKEANNAKLLFQQKNKTQERNEEQKEKKCTITERKRENMTWNRQCIV